MVSIQTTLTLVIYVFYPAIPLYCFSTCFFFLFLYDGKYTSLSLPLFLKSCLQANCVAKQITFYCTWCLAMKLQLSTSELEKKRDLDTHPNLRSAAIGTPSLKRPKNSWQAHEALLTVTEMRDGVNFPSWMQTVGTTIPSRRDWLNGNESIAATGSRRMPHKFSIYV